MRFEVISYGTAIFMILMMISLLLFCIMIKLYAEPKERLKTLNMPPPRRPPPPRSIISTKQAEIMEIFSKNYDGTLEVKQTIVNPTEETKLAIKDSLNYVPKDNYLYLNGEIVKIVASSLCGVARNINDNYFVVDDGEQKTRTCKEGEK